MAHKVRTDVEFANLEQYQIMKAQLDKAGIKFDTFITYCVDMVWNQMLEEHRRQEAEEARNAISSHEPSGNPEAAPKEEGLDTPEQATV